MAKRKVLAEILEAIHGIETHAAGKSLGDFERDWLLRLAIQRALEIISKQPATFQTRTSCATNTIGLPTTLYGWSSPNTLPRLGLLLQHIGDEPQA
ncbi:hypothetical protein [Sinorhizobium meliloti]|uniref:hypothetical protein n=1 Tax=Rhizobium meliloti TaxID=382 RepID=UPI0013E40DD5|nr:hypothetical protein [Sinorhizobium meliloti]